MKAAGFASGVVVIRGRPYEILMDWDRAELKKEPRKRILMTQPGEPRAYLRVQRIQMDAFHPPFKPRSLYAVVFMCIASTMTPLLSHLMERKKGRVCTGAKCQAKRERMFLAKARRDMNDPSVSFVRCNNYLRPRSARLHAESLGRAWAKIPYDVKGLVALDHAANRGLRASLLRGARAGRRQ